MTVLFKRDQIFADVHQAFQRCTQDEAAWFAAWRRDKYERDQISRIRHAEREGTRIGMEKGMEKGLEQGLEKGKLEKAVEAARKLREAGVAIDIICQATGLDRETVESL